MKVLARAFFICILLVIVAVGIGVFMVNRYLASPQFPEDLSRMASEKVDGDLVVRDMRFDKMTAQSSQIALTNSGKIEQITIDGFSAKFGRWNVFQRYWVMDHMDCNRLHVHIRRKKSNRPVKKSIIIDQANTAPPAITAPQPAQPTPLPTRTAPVNNNAPFYERWLPQDIIFNRLSIDQFSGIVERRKDPVNWADVAVNGEFKADTLRLDLRGGILNLPLPILSQWDLNKATVIATKDTYEIKDGSFRLPGGGDATLNGSGMMSGDALSMTMELQGLPVDSLLTSQSKNATLSGMVDGRIFAISQGDETVTKGTITLNEGIVELPSVTKHVMKYIALDNTNKLRLDQCSSEVIHVADTTILENLKLSVGDAYKVRGMARLDGDTYTIDCQLGVSPTILNKFPARLRASYTPLQNHYWIPVSATGHKDNLAKDLGLKAVAALTASYLTDDGVINKVEKVIGKDLSRFLGDDAGEKLQKAEESLKKKGLDLLKKLF